MMTAVGSITSSGKITPTLEIAGYSFAAILAVAVLITAWNYLFGARIIRLLVNRYLRKRRIAWVSLAEELPSRGSVEFTTNGGTYVTLNWEYKLAFGPAINSISKPALRSLPLSAESSGK